MTEKEEMDEAMQSYQEIVKKEYDKQQKVVEEVKQLMGDEWYSEVLEALEFPEVCYPAEIVDSKSGVPQTDYDGDQIKVYWVNETINGGYTGDTFAGTIYFPLSNGKYLMFHYSM